MTTHGTVADARVSRMAPAVWQPWRASDSDDTRLPAAAPPRALVSTSLQYGVSVIDGAVVEFYVPEY